MDEKKQIIREHIESMKPRVTELMDTLFNEISNPERISVATYSQLVGALQTITKTFEDEEIKERDEGELKEIFSYFKEVI